ncbi:hypothetical protein GSI_09899 [Ganoderma sinense ZZ0214-1]|uniref:Alcohol dehydrogenase-like C-terminal domain-containing protein n=1 Tax=Ganoderma sinense ZZ0214-1 TaxID=1077348 RepID=A0A2G8S2G2_9APHY|nr:hypothetical protein GSI_09899 [Ganoderma sinense ZZ0214-1]
MPESQRLLRAGALFICSEGPIMVWACSTSTSDRLAHARRLWPRVHLFSFTYGIPVRVPPRIGAASLVHGLTALALVSEAAPVRPGDTVLVHAVAGGLGLWLAQACKARGAVVLGTTSSAAKAAVARTHGADHVILRLYRDEGVDVGERVLELTGGPGVHAIFDGIGRDTFATNLKAIRAKGTIVVLGTVSGKLEPFDPEVVYEKSVKFVYPS